MSKLFTLITGRSSEQGHGLHEGKQSEAYRRAVTLVEMNQEDMASMGLQEGDTVQVRTEVGAIKVPVRSAALPPDLIFIPMGPVANRLIGGDTQASGMPSFKGVTVEVEPA